MKAALSSMTVKTDRKDARGIAQLLRMGWFRPVHRKSMPAHLTDHLNAGHHVPGILTLNPEMSVGQTVEELLLVAGASDDAEYQDYILYLPLV